VQTEPDVKVNRFLKYDDLQLKILKNVTIKNFKDELSYANLATAYKLVEFDKQNKDGRKYGTVVWSNDEIQQWLSLFGLPDNSPLSVLVVEVLPQITNIFDHVSALHKVDVNGNFRATTQLENVPSSGIAFQQMYARQAQVDQGPSPLSDELGHHRILRTSPLTEVPFVC
jgi:hypothetical protein